MTHFAHESGAQPVQNADRRRIRVRSQALRRQENKAL